MRRHISNFPRLLSACCILAAVLALAGCAGVQQPAASRPATAKKIPTASRPLGPWEARISPASQQIPSFASLAPAVDRSIAYTARKSASTVAVDVPGVTLTWGRLHQGLITFRRILPELDRNPAVLAKYFTWAPLPANTLVTGYYAPTIEVSRTEHGPYAWPIYRNPGRAMAKKYNREAIDFYGALRGKGLEIGWAKDPIAVFFLHVQGSGRLRFVEDGSTSYVLYAGSNGRRYVGVGRVMVNAGCFTNEEMSMQAIRRYLEEHPSQIKQYLTANPSYIYFKPSQTPPVGAMGVPVTPHGSVAVDPGFVPYGTLMALDADLPGYPGPAPERFTGFVMAQDTGCMRGNHFDLYLGPGEKAAHQAGLMKGTGQAYLLVPR